ncbi:hypothetical protein LMTR13_15160 [Bradyrhizobium icense]|uniref:Uncharacterized protein n=1 Tax=Bradyrhizobium icense TaxID=1274631 RepID=A0A1B1UEV4_9BRAD|nr:hypothetical protein LMTR13_15160 [Bradyrhizobium icense]
MLVAIPLSGTHKTLSRDNSSGDDRRSRATAPEILSVADTTERLTELTKSDRTVHGLLRFVFSIIDRA